LLQKPSRCSYGQSAVVPKPKSVGNKRVADTFLRFHIRQPTGWRMQAKIFIVAIWMVPGAVSAQQSAKDVLASFGIKMVEPMTAKELAATKARVDAELVKSGAAAFFDNVSDANGGKARHRPSGLVCPLGKKGQRVLAAAMNQASCETKDGSKVYKTRVEKASEDATLELVAAKALADAQREPGYSASEGVSVTGQPRPGSGLPDHQTLRFLSRIDGRERISRLQVGVVHGWVLTERREAPNTNAQPSGMDDVLGEATFGTNITMQQ
jgi:hypothetical protein